MDKSLVSCFFLRHSVLRESSTGRVPRAMRKPRRFQGVPTLSAVSEWQGLYDDSDPATDLSRRRSVPLGGRSGSSVLYSSLLLVRRRGNV